MAKRNLGNPYARNVGGVDDSDGQRSFAPAGRVHKYDSGANTHGVSQRPPKAPPLTGSSRSDGPYRRGHGKETR